MQVGYVYTSAGRHENVSQEFCFPAICPQQFVSTWKVIHLTYIESELRKKKNKLQEKGQTKKKHTHNRHCSRKRRVSRKSLFLRLICCFDEFHLAAASVKSVSLPPTWSRPRIEWWKSPWYINSQTSQSGTSRLQIENILFKLEMIQVLSQQFLEHCFCIQKKSQFPHGERKDLIKKNKSSTSLPVSAGAALPQPEWWAGGQKSASLKVWRRVIATESTWRWTHPRFLRVKNSNENRTANWRSFNPESKKFSNTQTDP